jgi:hypothetical protein
VVQQLWMTSFATSEADIARFAGGVQHFTRLPSHV